ncbi:MAG TPA: glycosyltransferase family 4 protein [Steroidobacteraceae bacterium]|nr:glycosyltransferase family 4 protein [Steroidobacteraceae bacterium]
MRVYVLTPSFPPTDGGQEKHLLELSESLIAAGACVQVFSRRVDPSFAPAERMGSVPVMRFGPCGEIKGVGLAAVPRLVALLCKMTWRLIRDRRRYDIVLVSGFNFMPMCAVVARAFTGKPCVVRPESPLEISEPLGERSREKLGLTERSLAVRVLRRLRRDSARRVDRYVAISAEIRGKLEQAGIAADRIVAVPNGIDMERYGMVSTEAKGALRRALGLPPGALLMIYTGRLAVSKGVMTLIEAWRELAPEFPAAHLLLVGTGRGSFDDCEPALLAYIDRHALARTVTLTGSVPNVHEYLKASDLFVFSSDYEGFSLSILEAMSVGLPLVSTRVGIAAELEAHAEFGLLVPPKDERALRDALRTLLPDADRRAAMGRAARSLVQSQYSLGAEAGRYLDLFGTLTASMTDRSRPDRA